LLLRSTHRGSELQALAFEFRAQKFTMETRNTRRLHGNSSISAVLAGERLDEPMGGESTSFPNSPERGGNWPARDLKQTEPR
jgi:hypothetical protein